MSSERLSSHLLVSLSSSELQIGDGSSLSFMLTPQGYSQLMSSIKHADHFALHEATKVSCSIPSFILPFRDKTAFTGQIFLTTDALQIQDKISGKTALLPPLTVKLQKDKLFSLEGNAKDIVTFSWVSPDLDSFAGTVQAKLKQFSPLLLDAFAPSEFPFTALFGDWVDLSLNSDIQKTAKGNVGTLSLQIDSPSARFSLQGAVDKNVFYLTTPLHAQITLTKPLSQRFLHLVNPLELTSLAASHPLTFEIKPGGFSCPLPFHIDQVTIKEATLELGKLTTSNQGNLNAALSLLKSNPFTKDQTMTLWFTPIVFSMVNGAATITRTDVLVSDTYQVALWGDLNFQTRYADMTLGLTASCLRRAFGLKGLPDAYVLQIPMKGQFDQIKLNTGAATTKIAALLAWQYKDLGTGASNIIPQKGLFGQILNTVGAAIPAVEEKAPPPKTPFPWDKSQSSKAPSSKKKKIKSTDTPAQQIKKIILG